MISAELTIVAKNMVFGEGNKKTSTSKSIMARKIDKEVGNKSMGNNLSAE